jgi:DNA-binding PadR family transcriptional regulator
MPGAVTTDMLAAAQEAALTAVFPPVAPGMEGLPAGKRRKKEGAPVQELIQPVQPGMQMPQPGRPLSVILAEKHAEAVGAGTIKGEWRPPLAEKVKGTPPPPKKKKASQPTIAGPALLQKMEWDLCALCAHCGDLNISEMQIQKETEALLLLRERMMSNFPGGPAWASGPKATPAGLAHLIGTTLSENGSHMAIGDLLSSPGIADGMKGVCNANTLPTFLGRFTDAFTVMDAEDEAGGKTVTLIGDVPPKPAPGQGKKTGGGPLFDGSTWTAWETPIEGNEDLDPEERREYLLRYILKKMSENGGEIDTVQMGNDPQIAAKKKGVVANLVEFLKKQSELIDIGDSVSQEGKPTRKIAKLTEQGWEAAHAATAAGDAPPQKKPKAEPAPKLVKEFDPDRAAKALSQIVDKVKELLVAAEGNKMKLEDVALNETVKELRVDLSKQKKLSQLLKDHGGLFEIKEGPRGEGFKGNCVWVHLAP